MSSQNYFFTKRLYWVLMVDCKKKKDEKGFQLLKDVWAEIEKLYEGIDLDILPVNSLSTG